MPAHSPASNWPRRDYHHGNRKWEELYQTDKDREHCSPGNQPSNTRRTCVGKFQHPTEALISRHLHTTTAATCCVYMYILCSRELVTTSTMHDNGQHLHPHITLVDLMIVQQVHLPWLPQAQFLWTFTVLWPIICTTHCEYSTWSTSRKPNLGSYYLSQIS